MYVAKEDYNLTVKFIGDNLGGRDHSTVIHGVDKMREDIKNNDMVKQDYEFIKKRLAEN